MPESLWSLCSFVWSKYGTHHDPIYPKFPLHVAQRDIRLVYVQKGNWNDEIECKLKVVSLNSRPKFEALSYAWGEATRTKPILLNGYRIEVGANLESALRRLRHIDEERALWADAISINQRDVQERNNQMLLMGDIYSVCHHVLIWLGHPEGTQNHRFHSSKPHEWYTDFSCWNESSILHEHDDQTITALSKEIKQYYNLPFSLRHGMFIDKYLGAYCFLMLLAQNKHIDEKDVPFLLNHDAFHRFVLALDEIMHCQWWSRQWVIQEVVLPATVKVYFGNFVAPWELFGRAARNYDYHRTTCCGGHYTALHWNDIRLLEHFGRTVVEMDKLRKNWQESSHGDKSALSALRQLLWRFRDRSTTDPRDKIYTLLPLVTNWHDKESLRADYYSKTQLVFCAAAKAIIRAENTLDILMGTMEKNLIDLPSWVPDWTKLPARYEEERLERSCLFRAALHYKLEAKFVNDTFLKLTGIHVDEIVAVAKSMDYEDEEKSQDTFADWYALFCHNTSVDAPYPSGGSTLEAYWRTLCIDTVRSLSSSDVGVRYSRCSAHYMKESQEKWMSAEHMPVGWAMTAEHNGTYDDNIERRSSRTDNDPSLQDALREDSPTPRENSKHASDEQLNFVAVDFAICSATWNRRLFFTKRGFIGVGPPSTEIGDMIRVFGGGNMPFVIRNAGQKRAPGEGKRPCFQLLGDCYVHGIMDGEAVRDYEQKKQVVIFV